MSGSHTAIEETELFKRFVEVSDQVWHLCREWDRFAQATIGSQLSRALDSIGANLVEGDGRYSEQDAIHFFVIARGSAREASYWIDRAVVRSLIQKANGEAFKESLNHSTRALNNLITYRRNNRFPKVKEEIRPYDAHPNPEGLMPNAEGLSGSHPEGLTPKTEDLTGSHPEGLMPKTEGLSGSHPEGPMPKTEGLSGSHPEGLMPKTEGISGSHPEGPMPKT
ncbi:MAG TPA: four helix bundle protein, partial [Fimbriimonadaceae bacterium]